MVQGVYLQASLSEATASRLPRHLVRRAFLQAFLFFVFVVASVKINDERES